MRAFFSRIFEKAAASGAVRAAVPALLAGVFCFYNLWRPFLSGTDVADLTRIRYGSFLLAGLRSNSVAQIMPLFETVFTAALNLGASPIFFLSILSIAAYLLVFCAGYLLRGYWAGIVSLIGAGAFEAVSPMRYDDEQSFYVLFLLLVLSLLLLKRRDNTLKTNLLCGLAIGASILVRTPLILFPPIVVLLDWFYGEDRSGAFFRRSLALLGASYILLVPWGYLNYSVSGRFSFVDDRRAVCNLITAAKGSVYTMEGDPRKLANLGPEDSALGFFLRETARHPGAFALSVSKRLWHIFLISPPLFVLFLIALMARRRRDGPLFFGLPAYFILAHSALSIEVRYFYPLLYLLPPLITDSLWPGRDSGEGRCSAAEKFVVAAVWTALCAVLAVEAVVAAYPLRSAANSRDPGYLAGLPGRFPNDRVFAGIKCRLLWAKSDDAGYRACLASNNKKFGDKTGAYYCAAAESSSPAELPIPPGKELECHVISMFRQFELGDTGEAEASFRQAYAEFEQRRNMLRGEPYRKDRELALRIKENAPAVWMEFIYGSLLMWPPKSLAKTLSGLEKPVPLPEGLALGMQKELLSIGATGERMARRILLPDMLGLPSDVLSLLWKEPSARSRKMSDEAVAKIFSGDLRSAESLLLNALDLNPANSAAFMTLCSVHQRKNRTDQAIEACRSAAYAVYFIPENRMPALETLAAEAAFITYRLLKGSGRRAEAEHILRLAVDNAPAGWPRLSKARTALKR